MTQTEKELLSPVSCVNVNLLFPLQCFKDEPFGSQVSSNKLQFYFDKCYDNTVIATTRQL